MNGEAMADDEKDTGGVQKNTVTLTTREGEEVERSLPDTVTVTDRDGTEVQVEVGVDGKNPVSPNNPPAKALATPADVEKQLASLEPTAAEEPAPAPTATKTAKSTSAAK